MVSFLLYSLSVCTVFLPQCENFSQLAPQLGLRSQTPDLVLGSIPEYSEILELRSKHAVPATLC